MTPLYIVSALFGLSQGGIVRSYALIVRDYFPAREAGARVSLVLMATIVGMAVGGWLSGAIYDLTGSYQAAFLNGIGWNLLNMSIAFWLLLGRLRSRGAAAANRLPDRSAGDGLPGMDSIASMLQSGCVICARAQEKAWPRERCRVRPRFSGAGAGCPTPAPASSAQRQPRSADVG